MKTLSAAAIKTKGKLPSRAYPKEGTQLAEIMYALKRIPGTFVYLKPGNTRDASLRVLRDQYGLDIQSNKEHKSEYRVVGEWFGKEYVSYIDKD